MSTIETINWKDTPYYKEKPTFGRLYELRLKKNLKTEEVAELIGVSRAAYTNWENGKREPDISYIMKLARLYRVSIDYLVGASDYTDINREKIGKLTGLSDDSIIALEAMKEKDIDYKAIYAHILNFIISDLYNGDSKESALAILWDLFTSKSYPKQIYKVFGYNPGDSETNTLYHTFTQEDVLRIETQKQAVRLMDKKDNYNKWLEDHRLA